MNIGFDGKRAANNLTGLGNYSRSLLAQLVQLFDQNQYFVYTPKLSKNPLITAFFEAYPLHLRLPLPNMIKLMWRSFGIKRQLNEDKIDLYHGLSQEIPIALHLQKVKTVVTIHDLIYLRFPEYYKTIDRYIYNKKSEYACKNADRIIAISERTKQDIIAFYHIPEDKIEVIYQTCDDAFKQPYPEEDKVSVAQKYNLPEKYLLIVGTLEPRKNLLLLVEALQSVDASYPLVVVGKHKPYAKLVIAELERLHLTDRVLFLEGVIFEDLPLIYQMATVFIYPSLYEGFGIPIIEALYSGVPVIAATGSCLEEAGGPASIYVAPDDANALATQLNRVLADAQLRETMKTAGLNYVQRFNNELLAQQMMDCYLKTIEGKLATC